MSVKPLDATTVAKAGHDMLARWMAEGTMPDRERTAYEQTDDGTRFGIDLMFGDLLFYFAGVHREDTDEHPIIPILKGQVYGVDQGDEIEGG